MENRNVTIACHICFFAIDIGVDDIFDNIRE
jgi:hypothetical protein